jgi:hypothetical protein
MAIAMNNLKYIYQNRENDKSVIQEYGERLAKDSLEELVDTFNRQVKCGIAGVHRQALYLIALRKEFLLRLEQTPVVIDHNRIIEIKKEIELSYDDDGICHIKEKDDI